MTAIDPSTFVITEREPVKRVREATGIDRTPFYALFDKLAVNQVVEVPNAMTAKEARSVSNILRESAKDKNLAITFLADTVRNTELSAKDKKDDKQFYAWYVKGEFQARGPRAAKNGK